MPSFATFTLAFVLLAGLIAVAGFALSKRWYGLAAGAILGLAMTAFGLL
ncbi:MAG: hypothetical protein ACFB6S_19055 [Geminicoccaceae bacterium]